MISISVFEKRVKEKLLAMSDEEFRAFLKSAGFSEVRTADGRAPKKMHAAYSSNRHTTLKGHTRKIRFADARKGASLKK